jgi:hypothetical protein
MNVEPKMEPDKQKESGRGAFERAVYSRGQTMVAQIRIIGLGAQSQTLATAEDWRPDFSVQILVRWNDDGVEKQSR